jgi:nitrite reductase/ring-hydroxylating ferredoxin subunit
MAAAHDDTTHPPIPVCPSGELIDGGPGVKIPALHHGELVTLFFVRYQGQVRGYVNRCAHVGVELDWENSFFTRAGDLIMCARHGATYEPDTGVCVGGPCKGGRLTPVDVEEASAGEGQAVFWRPSERTRPAVE